MRTEVYESKYTREFFSLLLSMKRHYLLDHKHFFLFGYFFYLLTPYIIGETHAFKGFPGIELFQGFFQLIPAEKLRAYAYITLSWLLAFFLGHFSFKIFRPFKRTLHLFQPTSTSYSVSYVAIPLVVALILFAYLARGSLFGGYGSYDIAARGKMSTLLVAFNFFFLYQLVTQQKISWLLVLGTAVTALLLLSMGGRLYVFQTLLIYLIYKTSFAPRRWKMIHIAGFAVTGFLVGGAFGVWRLGESFSFDNAMYSFMAEPAFTWFSTSTFLIENDIPRFNIPWNFLTSFFNLIPNTFFSLKQYMVSTQAMGYNYQNPLGADSVWTTYIINFGSYGSFVFVFITGFILNFLRHLSETSRFWAVYYILVCGMLPFQFFRDGFYIINKQLFFNFLLLPGLILYFLKTIIYIQNRFSVKASPSSVKSVIL